MNISRIVAIFLTITCIGLGAATLNLVQQNRELNTQLNSLDSARQTTARIEGMGDRSERRNSLRLALEAEQDANAELRQELARLKGEPPPVRSAAPAPRPEGDGTETRGNRGGGGGEAWLERLRQQDPERYKQAIADRDQRRKQVEEWYDNTLAQLDARAQSPSTPDEVPLVNQISDTLAKLDELRQQMSAARQLPDDQRQAQMAQLVPEMQATWQQLTTLREQDRSLQYEQLGKQLGLTEDKAKALATSIPTILQNTQYTPNRGGGAGGGFGGGGWGGGGSGNTGTQTATPGR